MRQNRLAVGHSIRDAALSAHLSENTLRRVEAGFPIHQSNLAKLWRAYGAVPITYEAFRSGSVQRGDHYRIQTAADHVWYAMRLDSEGRSESFRFGNSLVPEERNRLGRLGLATHCSIPLRVRSLKSRFMPFLVEVCGRTDTMQDPSGERFIFGVRGRIRVWVGDESFIVGAGEAATFDSTFLTCMEAVDPVDKCHPAPQALVIVLP
jgi:hypothetical protein